MTSLHQYECFRFILSLINFQYKFKWSKINFHIGKLYNIDIHHHSSYYNCYLPNISHNSKCIPSIHTNHEQNNSKIHHHKECLKLTWCLLYYCNSYMYHPNRFHYLENNNTYMDYMHFLH